MKQDVDVTPLDSKEVRRRRRLHMQECTTRTTLRKGDRRVTGNRFCSVCGRRLAVVPTTGDTQVIQNHYSCYYNELFTAYVCEDSRSCQRRHKKLRGGE